MEPTQVSFGNFAQDVSAQELADFLELKVGLVLRCKVKNVSGNTPPHAFVHFESSAVAKEAIYLATRGRLIFREVPLVARMDDRAGRRVFDSLNASHIQLVNVKVDLGSVTGYKTMLVSWEGSVKGPTLQIQPAGRRLRFFFNEELQLHGGRHRGTRCDVMLEIRLREVRQVREVASGRAECALVLLLQLWSPPYIFYRTAEDDIYEYCQVPGQLADDEDPWIRSLDVITPDKSIGRCLDYKITVQPRQSSVFKKVLAFFKCNGVLQKSVQATYDLPRELKPEKLNAGHYFFQVAHQREVPFDLMFLVNALVHHNIVHETSLTATFYRLLRPASTPVHISTFALRYMLSSYRKWVPDATKLLQSIITWAGSVHVIPSEPKITEGNMVVRRLIITPTRALCLAPEIELSNRVIRHFSDLSDRFLRVSFLDENFQPISSAALSVQISSIVRAVSQGGITLRTAVYRRILAIMNGGFWLCGRHYDFLAFSANQLRDNSAWFFARNNRLGVDDIREWMGTFPGGNVAKYAARMGQCFSSTFSTLRVPKHEVANIPDIWRNNYNFSDGCGMINPSFAQKVAAMLTMEDNPPSAYQIRYAGYKGVVAVWPIEAGPGYKLGLRDSMKKFLSRHAQLEIVSWARFLPCYLNRQIITLLSTLQVKDEVFIELQDTMVDTLNRMVDDRDLAYSVLMAACSGELYSTPLRMLCAGFSPKTEPHLKSMLVAIRAGQMEDLVQKSKIFVPNGRWLLGCMDETATLEYGQCFVCVSSPPKGDLREGKSQREQKVIKGLVVMTKNPCMHPGDIRILEAVDVPALHHLVDCLVVPQNGPRPHPNEASGSDLDGDVYFVSWDTRLLPPSGESGDPMEYSAQPARIMRQAVKTEHVVEFFAKHMVNDSLGKICNAHVVHADGSEMGALDDNCLYLAELAAKAVDYPKTGKPAIMPHELKPKQYPDFMGKDDAKTYESKKILGVLYRKVQGILPKSQEELSGEEPELLDPVYDDDLEVSGFEAYVEEAWVSKQSYDQELLAIMNQFSIRHEGEVVTGQVMLGPRPTCRRLGDVKERVKLAYLVLKREFRRIFEDGVIKEEGQSAGASDDLLDPDTAAHQQSLLEAKASAWYHVTYHPQWYHKRRENAESDLLNKHHLLSFPWLAVDYLVAIKNKKIKTGRK